MLQPHIPQQGIVPLLIQVQLTIPPQARVDFSMLVEVGRIAPAAVACVQVEDVALADVDEEADGAAASSDKGLG